jgi:predicted transcriptional regulator
MQNKIQELIERYKKQDSYVNEELKKEDLKFVELYGLYTKGSFLEQIISDLEKLLGSEND